MSTPAAVLERRIATLSRGRGALAKALRRIEELERLANPTRLARLETIEREHDVLLKALAVTKADLLIERTAVVGLSGEVRRLREVISEMAAIAKAEGRTP